MRVPTRQITKRRLNSWEEKLAEVNATPILLIGLGHDPNSGEMVVFAPEGVSDDLLIGSLLFALEQLQPGTIPQHHGQSAIFERPR